MTSPNDSLQALTEASEKLKLQSKLAILRMDRALARLLEVKESIERNMTEVQR